MVIGALWRSQRLRGEICGPPWGDDRWCFMTGVEDDFSLSPSRRKAEQQVHPLNRGKKSNKISLSCPKAAISEVLDWRCCGCGMAAYARGCKLRSCACPQTDCNLVLCLLQLWCVSVEADGVKERPVTLLLELLEELLYFVLHVFRVLDLQGQKWKRI